jgi:hypothetical protein
LATPPVAPLTESMTDVTVGADGSTWAEGSDDDRSWLFVSRDRGQSWTEVPLPAPIAKPSDDVGLMASPAGSPSSTS